MSRFPDLLLLNRVTEFLISWATDTRPELQQGSTLWCSLTERVRRQRSAAE